MVKVMDKYGIFRNFNNLGNDEAWRRVKEAQEECPILNLRKCNSYYFDEGVVYLSDNYIYAFTIPEWNEECREFSYIEINMDDEFTRNCVYMELDELLSDGWSIKELEKLYEIKIG